MHLAGGHPEPVGLAREVAADLVGVQVGLGEEVAHAGQRQVPAVAGGAQELLEHREVQRLLLGSVGVAGSLHPAVEGGDVVAAGLGQRLVDLDVGVVAGGDLAEHLHQAVLAERQRGVALLAGEQRGVRGQVELVPGQPVERQVAVVVAGVEGLQPQDGDLAVVHRVVGVHGPEVGVLPLTDLGVLEAALRLGVVGDRDLVGLGLPVGVGEADQLDAHERGAVLLGRAERAEPAHVGDGRGPPLAAEPAGGLDELLEVGLHAPDTSSVVTGSGGAGRELSDSGDGSRNQ